MIHSALERRHYWRKVSFDELGELYTSIMLRSIGMSLIGIFIPIYLYKLDYALGSIFLFLALQYVARAAYEVPVGYLIARVGPKHTMLLSYLMQILSLLLLLTLPQYNWPLWSITLMWAAASSLFFLSYHVDFSKVMHNEHGGKELGIMMVVERLGGIFGPLIGGVVATIFGASYTIAAAIIIFVFAVMPLFLTPEPIKTHQKLDFVNFPFRRLGRDFLSYFGYGAEGMIGIALWPLFVAVFIFTTNTYASIGAVTSAGVVAAMLSAQVIGKLVDRRHGGNLLKYSVIGMGLLHLARPFISGGGGVVVTNTVGEVLATGYRLPYLKGYYGQADDLPGYRIVYIVYTELFNDIGKALPWFILWGLSFVIDNRSAMQIGFVMAAVFSLLILVQRFPALRR